MPNYIINTDAQAGALPKIHDENSGCQHLPDYDNRQNLGWFSSSNAAIEEARKTFAKAQACENCAL